jgi:hypothetical protein
MVLKGPRPSSTFGPLNIFLSLILVTSNLACALVRDGRMVMLF